MVRVREFFYPLCPAVTFSPQESLPPLTWQSCHVRDTQAFAFGGKLHHKVSVLLCLLATHVLSIHSSFHPNFSLKILFLLPSSVSPWRPKAKNPSLCVQHAVRREFECILFGCQLNWLTKSWSVHSPTHQCARQGETDRQTSIETHQACCWSDFLSFLWCPTTGLSPPHNCVEQ